MATCAPFGGRQGRIHRLLCRSANGDSEYRKQPAKDKADSWKYFS